MLYSILLPCEMLEINFSINYRQFKLNIKYIDNKA